MTIKGNEPSDFPRLRPELEEAALELIDTDNVVHGGDTTTIPDGPADLTVRIELRDRGPEPEWHKDRSVWGPWNCWHASLYLGDELLATDTGDLAVTAAKRVATRWVDR
jgi:hypothetical protein